MLVRLPIARVVSPRLRPLHFSSGVPPADLSSQVLAMANGGLPALGTALSCWAVVLASIVAGQRALLFPTSALGGVGAPVGASDGRLVELDVSADAARPRGAGARLAAVYFEPAAPGKPTVAYFHANADQLGWGVEYIGATLHARFGWGFYGVEFPGYGLLAERGGAPSEASIVWASARMLRHLTAARDDGGGLGEDARNVVLMGQSLGTAVALELAARSREEAAADAPRPFAKVVLLSPFLSIPEVARSALLPLRVLPVPVLRAFVRDPLDNAAAARRLRRSASGGATRVQILHGDQDEIVPYSHGVELASLIREAGDSATAEMVTVPKAGHNDLWAPHYETSVLEAIRDFVERP